MGLRLSTSSYLLLNLELEAGPVGQALVHLQRAPDTAGDVHVSPVADVVGESVKIAVDRCL